MRPPSVSPGILPCSCCCLPYRCPVDRLYPPPPLRHHAVGVIERASLWSKLQRRDEVPHCARDRRPSAGSLDRSRRPRARVVLGLVFSTVPRALLPLAPFLITTKISRRRGDATRYSILYTRSAAEPCVVCDTSSNDLSFPRSGEGSADGHSHQPPPVLSSLLASSLREWSSNTFDATNSMDTSSCLRSAVG